MTVIQQMTVLIPQSEMITFPLRGSHLNTEVWHTLLLIVLACYIDFAMIHHLSLTIDLYN